MSQAQTLPAALTASSRPLVSTATEAVAIPRAIWFVVAGSIGFMVGAHWDLAWHRSIGRDMFLTPPHMLVQSSAFVVAVASIYTILRTTFGENSQARGGAVSILGLRGPAGAFMSLWGGIAMMVSAPFDNWWHNAFGLDVKVFTLPHMLLSLGYFIVIAGALAWIASVKNNAGSELEGRLAKVLLFVGGLDVVQLWVGLTDPANRQSLHMAAAYVAVAGYIPYGLVACGWASVRKWGCTIITAIYMAIEIGWIWVLPLIPAQPKLGPVYQNVTHLIPLEFPLLLIVPAFVTDLLLQRLENRSSWVKALFIGPAFMLSFLAAEWPFANFLMSPASRNWIFGTAYFAYADPAGTLYDPYKFTPTEPTPDFVAAMIVAIITATIATRLGLAWGTWMRRVRR